MCIALLNGRCELLSNLVQFLVSQTSVSQTRSTVFFPLTYWIQYFDWAKSFRFFESNWIRLWVAGQLQYRIFFLLPYTTFACIAKMLLVVGLKFFFCLNRSNFSAELHKNTTPLVVSHIEIWLALPNNSDARLLAISFLPQTNTL